MHFVKYKQIKAFTFVIYFSSFYFFYSSKQKLKDSKIRKRFP